MGYNQDYIFELEQLTELLESDSPDIQAFLAEYHPTEIARFLEALSQADRTKLVHLLSVEIASEAISEMDPETKPEKLLASLHPELAADILEELSDDDATDILSEMSEYKQNEILQNIDAEDARDIRRLMSYAEDTAGGLMTTEVIKVQYWLKKKEALDEVIKQSEEMGEFFTIYAIDKDDKLLGYLSLKDLIKAKPQAIIEDIMHTDVVFVQTGTDQEEVARIISQYNLPGIPVVDDNMFLLGRVTFDDVMDVLQEESTEDILKISGVSDNEGLIGTWFESVKSRLPWLILNLGTAFLAASVIRSYQGTVEKLLVLSAYMTMIAGMGGNAATQALAVTIRRISLYTINDKQAYRTVLKESLVGLTNGAVNGFIVFLAAIIFDGNPMLGLVVFLSMTGNLMIAGLAGSSIPLILKRIGVDPAIASSIIITTFTDTIGFFLLLSMASALLL